MNRHLVILARAPQAGRVKRRLGRDIGMVAAARFYRDTLHDQLRRLSNDTRWKVWLFITPDNEIDHPIWRRAVPLSRRQRQGHGDLGRRMKLPFGTLPPGPVVLVGSDIPAMRSSHIAHAFRLLGRHDLVFGPASDGGFWLVGSSRIKPIPSSLFTNVHWSTRRVLADTLAGIPRHCSVGLADTLDDVDNVQDLQRIRRA